MSHSYSPETVQGRAYLIRGPVAMIWITDTPSEVDSTPAGCCATDLMANHALAELAGSSQGTRRSPAMPGIHHALQLQHARLDLQRDAGSRV